MGQGIQAWTPSKVCGRQPLKNLKSYDLHWGVHFIYFFFGLKNLVQKLRIDCLRDGSWYED